MAFCLLVFCLLLLSFFFLLPANRVSFLEASLGGTTVASISVLADLASLFPSFHSPFSLSSFSPLLSLSLSLFRLSLSLSL